MSKIINEEVVEKEVLEFYKLVGGDRVWFAIEFIMTWLDFFPIHKEWEFIIETDKIDLITIALESMKRKGRIVSKMAKRIPLQVDDDQTPNRKGEFTNYYRLS